MSGWKFGVGEIALAQRKDGTWHECEIVALPDAHPACCAGNMYLPRSYVISVPSDPNPGAACGHYGQEERYLRKRRPPEQPAEDEFQRDLQRWLGVKKQSEVKV